MSRHCRFKDDPNHSAAEREVHRQVNGLRRFYKHLLVFVAINAGLAAMNLFASPGHLWFHWPLLGWAVWLALHAFGIFTRDRWLGAEWEERKVRQLLATKTVE